MNILIVDDDILIRKWLKLLLEQTEETDLSVFEAEDGIEAIEKCNQQEMDLVLTDIKMPRMDGIELIDYLNKNKPQIKTSVLSSYDDFEYVRNMLKLGALDYILKAELTIKDIDELLKKVKSCMQKEHTLSENTKDDIHLSSVFRDYLEGKISKKSAFTELSIEGESFFSVILFKLPNLPDIDIIKVLDYSRNAANIQDKTAFCFSLSPSKYVLLYEINNESREKQNDECLRILTRIDRDIYEHSSIKILSSINFAYRIEDDLREKIRMSQVQSKSYKKSYSPAVIASINFAKKHYESKVSLGKIAAENYVNKSYLSQLFKKEVGISFSSYVEQVRLQNAKSLLKNTDFSISEIAVKSGFANQNYFSKVFKKAVGLNPLSYKRYGPAEPVLIEDFSGTSEPEYLPSTQD